MPGGHALAFHVTFVGPKTRAVNGAQRNEPAIKPIVRPPSSSTARDMTASLTHRCFAHRCAGGNVYPNSDFVQCIDTTQTSPLTNSRSIVSAVPLPSASSTATFFNVGSWSMNSLATPLAPRRSNTSAGSESVNLRGTAPVGTDPGCLPGAPAGAGAGVTGGEGGAGGGSGVGEGSGAGEGRGAGVGNN